MKRFAVTLIGAALAFLATSGAHADTFTVTRSFPGGTTITKPLSGSGTVTLTITSPTTESPQATCDPPGTSLTLLNYQVTTTLGASGSATFADALSEAVSWKSYGQTGNPTALTNYDISVTGTVNPTQDNLVLAFTPVSGADLNFMVGTIPYSVSNIQETLPPIVNDTANPGAVSAVVTCIPEPGSMALLAMGALPILGLARRRRK